MTSLIVIMVVVIILVLIAAALALHGITQYEMGVVFRFGRVAPVKRPGLAVIIPIADRLTKVSLRVITMPIQTTLRKVVGKHTLDEMLAETDVINADIRKILDVTTVDWGVEVTLVELKDIKLPDTMKRAMAKQAEAEREKRAKIIAAEGESLAAAALGDASDTMMAHPLALQLRNLQTLIELGVDKNTTVVFPAPLMSTISELGAFLARETAGASTAVEASAVDALSIGPPTDSIALQPRRPQVPMQA